MSGFVNRLDKGSHLTKIERVPKSYKETEKILNKVKACEGSPKTILYSSRLRGGVFRKVYALVFNILKHGHLLEKIIEETKLLEKETYLRKELAFILIYELIFSKLDLPGQSKPVLAVKRYQNEIKEAYEKALKDDSIKQTSLLSIPRYARINTLTISLFDVLQDLLDSGYKQLSYKEDASFEEFLSLARNIETGSFLVDFHFKDLLVFSSRENFTEWHLYQRGHIFLQDKTSYIPIYALDPKPNSVVLDACAAPGMKTCHMATVMGNQGKIYAYERNKERFKTLNTILKLAKINICEAFCEDFYLVNANDPKFYSLEYILVDPSCSGSGMVSRMDEVTDTINSKNTLRLQKLAGFQILLLKHALSFPFVKKVVYSTCSISQEENEFVVHEVLNEFSHSFQLVSVMPAWPIRGSDEYEFGHLCLRAYPQKTLTNGFFVAVFERKEFNQEQFEKNLNNSFLNKHKKDKKSKKKKDNTEKNIKGFIPKKVKIDEDELSSDHLQKNLVTSSFNRDKERNSKPKGANNVMNGLEEMDVSSIDENAIVGEVKEKHKKKHCKKSIEFEINDDTVNEALEKSKRKKDRIQLRKSSNENRWKH